jgi:hypothetical protein
VETLKDALRACSIAALCLGAAATPCATSATPVTTAVNAERQPARAAQSLVFETSVSPQSGEDLATACRYENHPDEPSRTEQAVWVIFERSRDTLEYYRDADVRAFARRHDLALLFPFHCRSRSETGGDMNMDPLAFQDVADRLVAHLVAEIGKGPGDVVIPPVAVVGRKAHDRLFNASLDRGSTWVASLLRAIELPRDEPSVPGGDRLGPHDTCDFREDLASERLADLRQGPALAVSQLHSAMDFRPEDTILSDEILVAPEELPID